MSYPRLMLSTGQIDDLRTVTPLAEFLSNSTDPYIPNPRLNCETDLSNGKDSPKCIVRNKGTDNEPQIIIEGAVHEWDLTGVARKQYNSTFPPRAVKNAQAREVETVVRWLKEWKKEHGGD